jgi:paired amphipathic helix protein Sin3a
VGIPIGSEESYSFRFMRKNQYEEALFKCEDDQFEIDMIIDTNASAIRILEPIAEEINSLRYVCMMGVCICVFEYWPVLYI